jgi:rod shape-determining protein MreC
MRNTRVKQDLPIKYYIHFLKNHLKLAMTIVLIFLCLFMLYLEKKNNQTLANIKIKARDYIMSSSNLPLLCIRNSFIDSVKKCKSTVNERLDPIDKDTLTTEILYSENLRLKNLLNFALSRSDWEYVTTRITAINKRGSAFIAVGTDHGIQNNQLVINENGLVGKVIDVGKSSARLLLLNDKNFRIPIMMVSSGMKAIAVGSNSDYLQLSYLPSQIKIKEGELVVTIGDNNSVLPEIYVGHIAKDNRVKTNINLGQIDFVSIIKPKFSSN